MPLSAHQGGTGAPALAKEAPFAALGLHRTGELLEDLHLCATKVVDGLLPVSDCPEQPGLERQRRGTHGAELPGTSSARLGEEVDQLQLDAVGVLELIEQQRADSGLLPAPEGRVSAEQRAGPEEQLGEVERPGLLEGRALALLQLDQEPLPGLLVRAGKTQRHRSQWRGRAEEPIAERLQTAAQAVAALAPGQCIAQLGQPRRAFQGGPRAPAHQDVGQGGENREAVGSLGPRPFGGHLQQFPDPALRLHQRALDVLRRGERRPAEECPWSRTRRS